MDLYKNHLFKGLFGGVHATLIIIVYISSGSIGESIFMAILGTLLTFTVAWILFLLIGVAHFLKIPAVLFFSITTWYSYNSAISNISKIEEQPPKTIQWSDKSGNVAWDGRRSRATGRGAASHHGGVKNWTYETSSREATMHDVQKWKGEQGDIKIAAGVAAFILVYSIFGIFVSTRIIPIRDDFLPRID